MIFDLSATGELPDTGRYDVCIAGGGVAGIVLAHSLARKKRRTLLLEAGGLEFTEESQQFYQGQNIGRPYFDLDVTRLRFFGGTSNHWRGWCRPLDRYDFQPRDYVAGSGWPIRQADLDPYRSAARDILEIEEFPDDRDLPGPAGELKEVFFRFSPPVIFGEKYHDVLRDSDEVDVVLNANLVNIVTDPGDGRVRSFEVKTYGSGEAHRAVAERYVLALGGIENARLLLHLADQAPTGLVAASDLVGRFFMEHLKQTVGYYIATDAEFGKDRHMLALTPAMMDQKRLPNGYVYLLPTPLPARVSWLDEAKHHVKAGLCKSATVTELLQALRDIRCPGAGRLETRSEQVPNPNSRLTLSDEVDGLGLRRVAMDWQLLPVDKSCMRAIALAVAEFFARADVGRVQLLDWVLSDDDYVPRLIDGEHTGGNHHMGTTRMGASGADGVVDADCRVFGVPNLYVAGSSVFRTAGYANPTFTIVQLTLRLADHLGAQ